MPRLSGLLILLVWLSSACRAPSPASPGQTGDGLPPGVEQALTIPSTGATRPALQQLASSSACAARWLRARYLLDLFDAARLAPRPQGDVPDTAHALLWEQLALPGDPGRGRLATRQVLAGLRQALEWVPAGCPQRALVRDGTQMLESDQAPRASGAEALAAAVTYKRLARGNGELAPNARLRLVDWCLQAFRLAAGGAPALQQARINHCLYPLFDADPRPYFDADPARRPPDPPWPLLRGELERQLEPLSSARPASGAAGSRLARVAARVKSMAEEFFEQAAHRLPAPLDLSRAALPAGTTGDPWDRTPLIVYTGKGYIVGGQAVLEDDEDRLPEAIAVRLAGDRRGRVMLVAAPDAPASVALVVGRAARLAGATVMELGLVQRVLDRAPAGDVQAAVFGQRPVLRLHGIPVALPLLASRAAPATSRDHPRGGLYDPATAGNRLALQILQGGQVQASSRDGLLPPTPSGSLLPTLRQLRRAYPADRSMVLVPGYRARHGDLVAAAGLIQRDRGQPLYPGLALAGTSFLAGSSGDLAPVLRLLAGASVTTEPTLPGARGLRACYLEVLVKLEQGSAAPRGKLLLKRGRRGLRVAGGDLRHRGLRRCVIKALEGPSAAGVSTLSVAFQPGG